MISSLIIMHCVKSGRTWVLSDHIFADYRIADSALIQEEMGQRKPYSAIFS